MKELGGRLLTNFGILNGKPRMLRNAGFKMEVGSVSPWKRISNLHVPNFEKLDFKVSPLFYWVELYVFNSNPGHTTLVCKASKPLSREWKAMKLFGDMSLCHCPHMNLYKHQYGGYNVHQLLGNIFGHAQLRSECLKHQPVTCWHLLNFLYYI